MIAAARERGEPVPKHILDRLMNEVWAICRPMWNCFWTLAGSRAIVSTGMGVQHGRLAYTEISGWAKDHDAVLSPADLDEFVQLVQKMDTEWLRLNQPKK